MLLLCSQIISNQKASYPLFVSFAKISIYMACLCGLVLLLRGLLLPNCLFGNPFLMGITIVSIFVAGISGLLSLWGGRSISHVLTGYPLAMSLAKIGILTSACMIFPCLILYLPLVPLSFVRGLGIWIWVRWGQWFGPRGRIWNHNSFPAGPLALFKALLARRLQKSQRAHRNVRKVRNIRINNRQ
jgi:hypothetical protein